MSEQSTNPNKQPSRSDINTEQRISRSMLRRAKDSPADFVSFEKRRLKEKIKRLGDRADELKNLIGSMEGILSQVKGSKDKDELRLLVNEYHEKYLAIEKKVENIKKEERQAPPEQKQDEEPAQADEVTREDVPDELGIDAVRQISEKGVEITGSSKVDEIMAKMKKHNWQDDPATKEFIQAGIAEMARREKVEKTGEAQGADKDGQKSTDTNQSEPEASKGSLAAEQEGAVSADSSANQSADSTQPSEQQTTTEVSDTEPSGKSTSIKATLAETAYKTITSVFGVKFATDLARAGVGVTAKLLGKETKISHGDIYNYVAGLKGTKKEKKDLAELTQSIIEGVVSKAIENSPSGPSSPEGTPDNEGSIVVTKMEELKKKIQQAEYIKNEDKELLYQKLEEILAKNEKEKKLTEQQKIAETQKALALFVQNKVSGISIARDALNTALTASGLFAARGIMYAGAAVLERGTKASKQYKKDKFLEKDTPASWESKTKFVFKDVAVNSVVETLCGLAGQGITKERKDEGKRARAVDFIKAAGSVARMVGIGFTAASDSLSHTDRIEEILEAINKGDLGGAGKEMVSNLLDNANRIIHLDDTARGIWDKFFGSKEIEPGGGDVGPTAGSESTATTSGSEVDTEGASEPAEKIADNTNIEAGKGDNEVLFNGKPVDSFGTMDNEIKIGAKGPWGAAKNLGDWFKAKDVEWDGQEIARELQKHGYMVKDGKWYSPMAVYKDGASLRPWVENVGGKKVGHFEFIDLKKGRRVIKILSEYVSAEPQVEIGEPQHLNQPEKAVLKMTTEITKNAGGSVQHLATGRHIGEVHDPQDYAKIIKVPKADIQADFTGKNAILSHDRMQDMNVSDRETEYIKNLAVFKGPIVRPPGYESLDDDDLRLEIGRVAGEYADTQRAMAALDLANADDAAAMEKLRLEGLEKIKILQQFGTVKTELFEAPTVADRVEFERAHPSFRADLPSLGRAPGGVLDLVPGLPRGTVEGSTLLEGKPAGHSFFETPGTEKISGGSAVGGGGVPLETKESVSLEQPKMSVPEGSVKVYNAKELDEIIASKGGKTALETTTKPTAAGDVARIKTSGSAVAETIPVTPTEGLALENVKTAMRNANDWYGEIFDILEKKVGTAIDDKGITKGLFEKIADSRKMLSTDRQKLVDMFGEGSKLSQNFIPSDILHVMNLTPDEQVYLGLPEAPNVVGVTDLPDSHKVLVARNGGHTLTGTWKDTNDSYVLSSDKFIFKRGSDGSLAVEGDGQSFKVKDIIEGEEGKPVLLDQDDKVIMGKMAD